MPEFSYTARDLDGEKVNGQISAASQREALNLLSGRSLFPLSVTLLSGLILYILVSHS